MSHGSKYMAITKDTEWVLKNFGSDAGESREPGSKIIAQAQRIAEFSEQWDYAEYLLSKGHDGRALDLIRITGVNS